MKKLFLPLLLFSSVWGFGQEKVTETFKDTRIVNGHSVETSKKGQMKFIISHRFGNIDGGIKQMYGLDAATMRLGLDYGISDRITVGAGRSSYEKTVDGFVKARLMYQEEDGKPISITWFSASTIKTIENFDKTQEDYFRTRVAYTNQLLIARKFSDGFALQIMPTHLHKNLVSTKKDKNDIISIGSAARIQLTKLLSFKAEYYYTLPDQLPDVNTNSLSLGFDIETKNHVFQMHFSNSAGMTEKFFIAETYGDWGKGEFGFGFNITRDFQLTGKKYK